MQQLNIKWLNLSYYLHNTLFPAVQLFDIISIIIIIIIIIIYSHKNKI